MAVVLEWTPEALIQYLPVEDEVHVTVHADDSMLVCPVSFLSVESLRASQQVDGRFACDKHNKDGDLSFLFGIALVLLVLL